MYTIVSDDAFILGVPTFRESDRRIEIFTRTYGKIYAWARSVRKEEARLRTETIPYRYSRVTIVQGKINTLKDITTKEYNENIWNIPQNKIAFVQTLAFVSRFVAEEEPYLEIFDAVRVFFDELGKNKKDEYAKYLAQTCCVKIGETLGYVERGTIKDIQKTAQEMVSNKEKQRIINNTLQQILNESHL